MQPGFRQALATFHSAAIHVPAYKKILVQHNIRPASIRTEQDFARLPVLDKTTYLRRFPITELVPDKRMPAIAYASSGSTGTPTFWFRNSLQETHASHAHEEMMKTFGISKKNATLVVICFSMGVWVAGNSEFFAFHSLLSRGYNLSIVTPGIEIADILQTLKQLAAHFRYIILAGYPPFIKNLLYHLRETEIRISGNTRIITSGDSFTESWRDEILHLINSDNPCHILNIYGCADLGFLGHETPISITLRRAASYDPDIRSQIFGTEPHEPAFIQYNPYSIFVEQQESELLFTVNAGIPLIRYNLHDIGTILPYKSVNKIADEKKITIPHKLNNTYPFLIKYGRTDVAVTFYALNIYPDHLENPLKTINLPSLSGNLVAFTKESKLSGRQQLHIAVELAPGKTSASDMAKKIQTIITSYLLEHNIEYRKLYHTLAHKALPVVSIKKFGQLPKVRFGLLVQQGKKPKLIT